ncbi:MAG: hypothetical protein A2X55_08895 [Nitrospirae bacterium GWB2_47_37]|nr:MAG: hypothetical protein A2X55_08895 [Nitrospirae bacterium GWB2_47_37]HAK87628.1 hypothetical protein [Nitrospiraceae bacterium]
MLRNTKGFAHIGAVIFIFALVGSWFVYKSYHEEKLTDNLAVVLFDYKTALRSIVSDPADKVKADNIVSSLMTNTKQFTDQEVIAKLHQLQMILSSYPAAAELNKNLNEKINAVKQQEK